MKKYLCLLAVIGLLLPSACFALQLKMPEMSEKNSYSYENPVLGYSLRVPKALVSLPDSDLAEILDNAHSRVGFGEDDYLYDVRIWGMAASASDTLVLEVQLKKCTHTDFETEVANAPNYSERQEAQQAEQGNDVSITMLHDGILRETPAGTMLEMACVWHCTDADGTPRDTMHVYYDYYCNSIEYCFVLEAPERLVTLEGMQKLLADIMETVRIENVIE